MKRLRFLLVGMAICLTSEVKAQIYNSDVLFYVGGNELTNPQLRVFIIRFKEGKQYRVNRTSETELRNICNNLKSNSYYYEYKSDIWSEDGMFKHDRDMSNAKWTVYSYYQPYVPSAQFDWGVSDAIEAHTSYKAFKCDYSEYMEWSEPHYHLMGNEHGERITLKLISKEELKKLNFTGARDFLQ